MANNGLSGEVTGLCPCAVSSEGGGSRDKHSRWAEERLASLIKVKGYLKKSASSSTETSALGLKREECPKLIY